MELKIYFCKYLAPQYNDKIKFKENIDMLYDYSHGNVPFISVKAESALVAANMCGNIVEGTRVIVLSEDGDEAAIFENRRGRAPITKVKIS